jgi:protocatechuate 3,4-dioxygenase beta subunit
MSQLDIPAPAPLEDLDDDDRLIGRILTRREVLALIGVGGVAVGIAACAPGGSGSTATAGASGSAPGTATAGASATASAGASVEATVGTLPSCVVAPELTEGPYYLDVNLQRSDIRPNTADGVASEGAPLQLGWLVSQVDGDGCLPLEGAIVDVWHCDALGVYSGVQGSTGTDFLRGFQRTDASGAASFTTVYPGWYQGRAVHIHFKIRTDPDAEAGFEFTSQLFFDDALSAQVYSSGVYAAKGLPDQPNASDGIFNQSGGATLLDVTQDGDTYKTTFEIAVQLA